MGRDDPIVPASQGTALRDANPTKVQLTTLRAGRAQWEHGSARYLGAALSSTRELGFISTHAR